MYKLHTHCRACGLGRPEIPTLKVSTAAGPAEKEQKLIEVLDLGVMPLANDFVAQGGEHAGYAPLKLMWCPRCTLAQLSVVVDPKVLYKNYPYVTSKSQMMKDHFNKLATDLENECGKKGFVVEIGSNDGTLLEHLDKRGFDKCLGIEPADNLVDMACKRGVNTWCEYFTEETAKDILHDYGREPDLVIARHVFCHIDDWSTTIKGLDKLCGKDTVIAIEVPYLVDTIKHVEWDQIYHEHLSYLTTEALWWALKETKLSIVKVYQYAIHGGAIVFILRNLDVPHESWLINDCVTLENMKGFAKDALDNVSTLMAYVGDLVAQGKTVVGYGASAKSTQWIQRCCFTRKHLKFITDETPSKQYKCSPGTDIPIVDPGALTRELPDYAILFSWNYMDEIIAKEKIFRAKGGKWLIPHGKIEII